jgi:aminopeptidase N
LFYGDGPRAFVIDLRGREVALPDAAGLGAPRFTLANGDGLAYAELVPDSLSLAAMSTALPGVANAVHRAVIWLTLWDAMLEGRVPPAAVLRAGVGLLKREPTELITQQVLSDLANLYWRFLSPEDRATAAPELEAFLVSQMRRAPTASSKAAYFGALRSVAITPQAVAQMDRIWRGDERVPGLTLAERDFTALALELAVREAPGSEDVLSTQAERITNPDRQARFAFVRRAVSADTAVRDALFEDLSDPEHREHEPWVLEALRYLHHPLRAERARRYIRPSLDLLEEIQRTGDIFFPLGWLSATLSGHTTPEAADIVRAFLDEQPDLPARLRGKLLQAADPLFRSAAVVYGADG